MMSLVGRFWYRFKKNNSKQMSVVFTIEKCPWRITCHAIGSTKVVQFHTFEIVQNLSLDDVASSQPSIRAKRVSKMIDDVIRLMNILNTHFNPMFYLVFSNVFMLNKCPNALNVHIYD